MNKNHKQFHSWSEPVEFQLNGKKEEYVRCEQKGCTETVQTKKEEIKEEQENENKTKAKNQN
jgi:hypothetical protein